MEKGEMQMAKATRSYHEGLIKRLRADEDLQIEHLKSAAEDAELPEVFLTALRDVVEARGFAEFSKDSELNREHLYRLLSKDGNPKFDSLFKIFNALGIEMTFQRKSKVG
jgi:probable addiction module antidote protein